MSPILVKGIIISLSVVAAVGIALQSPEVRDWIDEQRRRLAEMLRSMSDGLDPHTRSQAEAFAFGGRMPGQQTTPTASATSREVTTDTLRHRSQAQTSHAPIDAAERRRLGREYLARRNQELLELRNKRNSEMTELSASTKDTLESPTTTTENAEPSQSDTKTVEDAVVAGNFIELINNDGTLRLGDAQSTTSSTSRAFDAGSSFANSFGDEYALSEHSDTLPPVPPKVPHEDAMPGSYPPEPAAQELAIDPTSPSHDDDYNTQLARALSLSLAENEEHTRTTFHSQLTEEEQFELAIRNSLSETQRNSTIDKSPESAYTSPLVDLSSDDQNHGQSQRTTANPWQASSDDDDLYFLTPTPTGAPVHSIEDMLSSARAFEAGDHESIPESSSHTLSPPLIPSLTPNSITLSPTTAPRDTMLTGFQSDTDSEDFASLSGSVAHSTGSLVEVEDVDIDSMSDDDGIRTPQSWSEIGSEMAESEHSEKSTDSVVRV